MDLTDWLSEAAHGPLRFRLVVQPLLALLLGLRDGRRDHALGEAPFLLGVLRGTGERRERLRAALRQIALPLTIAVVLDAMVQLSLRGAVDAVSALRVGALLIALPYVLARGVVNRALRIGPLRRAP